MQQGPWGGGPTGGNNDGNGRKAPPKRPQQKSHEPNWEELLRRGQQTFSSFNGGGGNGIPRKRLVGLVASALVLLWLSTGFYIVQDGERAVVMRLGSYTRTSTPGPNYRLPYPIEEEYIVNVERLNTEEIGFQSVAPSTRSLFATNDNPSGQRNVNRESLMLTGDENIVDMNFIVQWNVKDPKAYILNVRDGNFENTVKSAAESAMREVVSHTPYRRSIEGEGRAEITPRTEELLQAILDMYGMGVNVASVQIRKVDPPEQVIDAFRDVQTARADKEREINQAEAYRNDVIPRARGQAEQVIQEAEAYAQTVVARAEGEAKRFSSVYEQYKLAKDVTRQRIYLETMEDILQGMDKILLENKSGVVPYLPLGELNKKKE